MRGRNRNGAFGVPSLRRADLSDPPIKDERGTRIVSILWIILIVIVVLALLGFFSRGRW